MKSIFIFLTLSFSSLSFADYAAIAYSKHSAVSGWSFGYLTQVQAEMAALRQCARLDCEIKVWVQNGCAALYVSYFDRSVVGWGWSLIGPNAAQNRAHYECRLRSINCYQEASVCSDW